MDEQLVSDQAMLRRELSRVLEYQGLTTGPWGTDVQHLLSAPGKLLSSIDPSPRIPAGYWALLPLSLARSCAPSKDLTIAHNVALASELFLCALDYFDELEDDDVSPVRNALGDGRLLNSATALLVTAYRLLDFSSSRASFDHVHQLRGIVDQELFSAMRGQHQDLRDESLPLATFDPEESLTITTAKSGSLFRMVCQLGAVSVNASDKLVQKVADLGTYLGTAFQIENDVHDLEIALELSREVEGHCKSDLQRRKKTLPLVLATKQYAALQEASPPADSTEQAEHERLLLRNASTDAIAASLGTAEYHRLRVKELVQEIELMQGVSITPALRFLLGVDTL